MTKIKNFRRKFKVHQQGRMQDSSRGGGGEDLTIFLKTLWNLEKFGPQGRVPDYITGQEQRNFIRTTLPVIDSNWL